MWQNLHDEGYNNMDNGLLSCSYDHLFDDLGKIRYILLEVYWHSFRYLLEPAIDWKQTELSTWICLTNLTLDFRINNILKFIYSEKAT